MTDIKSRAWIVAKGAMFLGIVAVSASLIWVEAPSFKTILLIGLLVWSSGRLYYFLFYVLEKYVDPSLRYAGLLALMRAIWSRRGRNGIDA